MNKLNVTILAGLLSTGLVTALHAQEAEGASSERRLVVHHDKSPLFEALDLNGDGVVSTEEIARAPESLAALDLNQDGQLTPREIFRPRLQAGDGEADGRRIVRLREGSDEGGERRLFRGGETDQEGAGQKLGLRRGAEGSGAIKIACPVFNALDVNRDGIISADEIANSWMNLLALDENGDGAISLDEVRPSHPR